MLYSTIPPILIILSLAGIIIFFMKKAPQIARLNDEDDLEREKIVARGQVGFFGRIGRGIKNINFGGVKNFFLVLSEKLTRRARIFFLRLESKSKDLNDSIRTKRNGHRNKLDETQPSDSEREEGAVIEKVNNYEPQKKSYLAEMKNALRKEKVVEKKTDEAEEKIIKPMVSDRVATPSGRAEMKDRLEGLLIERIAANPKDVEAYERLGEYYMEIDSLNDAKECFKQVLKLDPKNRNVKYRMRVLESMIHRT